MSILCICQKLKVFPPVDINFLISYSQLHVKLQTVHGVIKGFGRKKGTKRELKQIRNALIKCHYLLIFPKEELNTKEDDITVRIISPVTLNRNKYLSKLFFI